MSLEEILDKYLDKFIEVFSDHQEELEQFSGKIYKLLRTKNDSELINILPEIIQEDFLVGAIILRVLNSTANCLHIYEYILKYMTTLLERYIETLKGAVSHNSAENYLGILEPMTVDIIMSFILENDLFFSNVFYYWCQNYNKQLRATFESVMLKYPKTEE